MGDLIKLEFIVVGGLILLIVVLGAIWYNTKNKRVEKFFRKIMDSLEWLLRSV